MSMWMLVMNNYEKETRLLVELIDHVESVPYDPLRFAKYIYAKRLDECIYQYEDKQLSEAFDLLGGMSAGEEFFYSKDETLQILNNCLSALKNKVKP